MCALRESVRVRKCDRLRGESKRECVIEGESKRESVIEGEGESTRESVIEGESTRESVIEGESKREREIEGEGESTEEKRERKREWERNRDASTLHPKFFEELQVIPSPSFEQKSHGETQAGWKPIVFFILRNLMLSRT